MPKWQDGVTVEIIIFGFRISYDYVIKWCSGVACTLYVVCIAGDFLNCISPQCSSSFRLDVATNGHFIILAVSHSR